MKLDGSVALVVGADSAVGAAIVRGLLARDAIKVYAVANDPGDGRLPPGAVPVAVNLTRPAHAGTLARQLADVTLLVNCKVAVQRNASALAELDVHAPARSSLTSEQTLQLIDALAPVLAANGGGAVVNLLSVLHADLPLEAPTPQPSDPVADWMFADALRERLASQRTLLLHFQTHWAAGYGDQVVDDQHALAEHVAMRALDRIETDDRCDRGSTWWWAGDPMPPPFRADKRSIHEHDD